MRQDPSGGVPTAMADTLAGEGGSRGRLSAGARAGDYEVVRYLGGGAMGDVYEGVQPTIGKRVAIKVIKNLLADSEAGVERFIREARAVNHIDHRHVLDVFAFGKLEDGRLYLVMDLLRGQSLGERIRQGGALSPEEFLAVFEPVCRALEAAHAAGVVHRDLKPDNIFLAEEGGQTHVYVLDFGIAKILSDAAAGTGQMTLTGEGVWVGSPAYMSPEQWAAEPASERSDIYSLGCTAFEMLTGRVPFVADSVPGIMQQHFNAEVPRLDRESDGMLSPALGAAVAGAMAKDPADRYAGAGEFLEAVCAGLAGSVAPALDAPRWGVRWLAAAAGLALLFGGAGWVWLGGGAAEPEAADEEPATRGETWSIKLRSQPAGASIAVEGHGRGRGELVLTELSPDAELAVVVSRPGYSDVHERLTAAAAPAKTVTLTPVRGFEGIVWRRADGQLRVFQRDRDRVAVFHLEAMSADPQFLRHFEFFKNEAGWVHFSAAVEYVDERAPREASCRLELVSEYRYQPREERLEVRRQRAPVGFDGRRCVVGPTEWGPWEPAEAVERTAELGVIWAEARAGSGGLRAFVEAGPQPLTLPAPRDWRPRNKKAPSKRNRAPARSPEPPQQRAEPAQKKLPVQEQR